MGLIAVAEAFQRPCSACPDWAIEQVASVSGSGDFTPLARGDGFVELDSALARGGVLPAGEPVAFHPWS